ncbi:hypothetical protein [Acidisphaera sp. S103]|uniref:hypothetical protein n=1 Tax=Acidisphaera sp. S103 TaxID=1747223 RepID=UPI00131B298A|nr:hypothetical protein [Acidisphaera sp. S103]
MEAGESCLAIRTSSEDLSRHMQTPDDGLAHPAMAAEGERWGDRLPDDPDDLWGWCLDQSQATLLDLLAYLAALTVNAVRGRQDSPDNDRLAHADQLVEGLGLDTARIWSHSVKHVSGAVSGCRPQPGAARGHLADRHRAGYSASRGRPGIRPVALGLSTGPAQGRARHQFQVGRPAFPQVTLPGARFAFFEFTGSKSPKSKWKFTKPGED